MYQYNEVDRRIVKERVAQFRDQTRRFLAGELGPDEFRILRQELMAADTSETKAVCRMALALTFYEANADKPGATLSEQDITDIGNGVAAVVGNQLGSGPRQ